MGRPKSVPDLDQDPRSSRVARGLRVKSIRQSLRMSRAAFAEKFGLSVHTLQNWEMFKNGGLIERRAHDLIQKLKLASIQCTFEWLMHGIGSGPTIVDPALSANFETDTEMPIRAGSPNPEDMKIADELALFRKHYGSQELDFTVTDDSMAPHYLAGDYVAGISRFRQEIAKCVGSVCIVQLETGELLLRHLKAGQLPGHYTLICWNLETKTVKPYLYDVKIQMAAPVLWFRRKYSAE